MNPKRSWPPARRPRAREADVNAVMRKALAETALDLDAWLRDVPLPPRDPSWNELTVLIANDPRLENVDQDVLISLFSRLSDWQRTHVQPGRVLGAVWHAVEAHLMYHRILTPAIECCLQLEMAYLKGAGDSGSIEWDDLDSAREHSVEAVKALGLKGYNVTVGDGSTLFALAGDTSRAMEAVKRLGVAPETAEVAEPYEADEAVVEHSGGPRP